MTVPKVRSICREIFATMAGLGLVGCVSVRLMPSDYNKRATGVQFVQPPAPFQPESREDVDGAWKNQSNGNLISFLSDCQDPSDPTLESVVQGALVGLNDLKIDSNFSTSVQGRDARRVQASGRVDGVPSSIDLLAFKRNRCIFILTYVGVKSSFKENHDQFDRFIAGFRAP
jgi:hypothetical protein